MTALHTCKKNKGKTGVGLEAGVPTWSGEMSILFEGGCGLQVAKRNWRSASMNTSMVFKLPPQPPSQLEVTHAAC